MFNKFIINKYNLINNIKQVKLNNPNSKICAMVKANAYGVGANEVVKILNSYVDYFGVACFFEAEKIKKYTNKQILIVGALERRSISKNFSYTCSSLADVKFLKSLHKKINIHLKVNSGMNRFGFSSLKDFEHALFEIESSKLNLEGVFTHFATDDEYVKVQMQNFLKFTNLLKRFKFNPLIHADNSAVNLKYNHNLDMVRVGFNLYNLNKVGYQQCVQIISQVVQINKIKKGNLVGYNYKCVANKETKVAVIPVGYSDGFSLRNIGLTLNINGYACKVLNVCMDCFMLDVTKTNIKKGTKVPILNEYNSLIKYAKHLNISEYEIMCMFSNIRADRVLS